MTTARTPVLSTLVAIAVSLAPASNTSLAQEAVDSRWLPWLGCWQASPESFMPEILLVCVRPADVADGVEIATIVGGEVASLRTLVADAQRHDVQGDECSGWQWASFSADGLRVFARSELTCEDGMKRSASAIMAIAAGEWLDAQSIGTDRERVPRVLRYWPAPSASWPAGFELSADRAIRVAEARAIASARLSMADVEEASGRVEPEAVVALLVERDQRFYLDASRLVALADAGVPDDVIDVLVAVSYPDRFAIDRQTMGASPLPEQRKEPGSSGQGGYRDPFGWGHGFAGCYASPWDQWSWDRTSWDYWSWYCSPYSYGAYPFGYGWYDSPRWGYVRPVIVVRDDSQPSRPGRLVRGRGYTRGGQPPGSDDGRFARPRDAEGFRPNSSSVRSGDGPPRRGTLSPSGYSRGGSNSSNGEKAKKRQGSNREQE